MLWKATDNNDCDDIDDMGALSTDGAGQAEDDFSASVGNKKQNCFVDIALDECVAPRAPKACSPRTQGSETSPVDNDSLFIRL